jgi:hypothetical protein
MDERWERQARVDRLATDFGLLLGILALPVAMLVILCNDLLHPNLWSDWKHDPRIYVPYGVILFATLGAISWARKWPRVPWMDMLDVVKRLYAAGRQREGDAAMRNFDRAFHATSRREQKKLVREFFDRFGH